jgi:hypothetical protein
LRDNRFCCHARLSFTCGAVPRVAEYAHQWLAASLERDKPDAPTRAARVRGESLA